VFSEQHGGAVAHIVRAFLESETHQHTFCLFVSSTMRAARRMCVSLLGMILLSNGVLASCDFAR
jgi:hypothetical protein